MGKEVRGVLEESSLSGAGVGQYLASQRRLRDISLDELAELTKIPRRSLERLEAGSFDGTSDGFVRGFVRCVAASLGLDPDEAVMRLMDEPEELAPAARFGLPAPEQATPGRGGSAPPAGFPRRTWSAAARRPSARVPRQRWVDVAGAG